MGFGPKTTALSCGKSLDLATMKPWARLPRVKWIPPEMELDRE
jgi:hypothetical protein